MNSVCTTHKTKDKKGVAAIYSSSNKESWTHLGAIKLKHDYGVIWECPDLFKLNGKSVFLFSPMGVCSGNRCDNKNRYSVSYILSDSVNYEEAELANETEVKSSDFSFDFYAPQTYLDEQGRRILIAWIGIPEIETPIAKNGWEGVLSIPGEQAVSEEALVQ